MASQERNGIQDRMTKIMRAGAIDNSIRSHYIVSREREKPMKKLAQLLKLVKDEATRLEHDEGAWLKSLGEIGDIARMVLENKTEIAEVKKRISTLEGKKDV